MKDRKEKSSNLLDYAIGFLMITILVLATFLMPQAYSVFVDSKDLNQVHAVERESFNFNNPVKTSLYERVQQMMEAFSGNDSAGRTLYLSGSEVTDAEMLEGVREALGIAIQYELLPDISAYEIEKHVVYAEYYNLSGGTAENTELAFWNIRFSDHETFDLTLRIDAGEYIIYQAQLYCAEATEYIAQLMSDDKEVTTFLNEQFTANSAAYFEAEGYDTLTDISYGDMVFMLGFERGEYSVYHAPCTNGYLEGEGIRWGFVPMTIALENSNAIREWGYGGVESYYYDLFGVEIYEDAASGKEY